MKEALHYEKEESKNVRCRLCPHNCLITPGTQGYCGVRKNIDGQLFSLTNQLIAAAASDPVEKKPLYHFYPGSSAYSLGGYGCNLACIHCQNHEISQARDEKTFSHLYEMTPDQIVENAIVNQCKMIAWTYNEPTIWYEYILETSKLAVKKGLKTVLITNGIINKKPLKELLPFIDAYRLDIKGFTNDFYKKLTGSPFLKNVLESGITAYKGKCHIEIVTNIIPGWNDSDEHIDGICNWINNELDSSVPWHITAYHPANELHEKMTPVKTLQDAAFKGHEAGIKHIYLGNVSTHTAGYTLCPECGKILVNRSGYRLKEKKLINGKCSECGYQLKMYQDD